MKYYVIHYPKRPERKLNLLKQFDERKITNVTWVEGFNKDHDFVHWIKERTKSPMPLGQISSSVKQYMIMKEIADNNISDAIIFEDDVVIDPEFDNLTIKHFPRRIGLIRLGAGVHILGEEWTRNNKPSALLVHELENPGGCECFWVSNEFSKNFIQNCNFDYSIDMTHMAFIHMNSAPLLMRYVCHQTSVCIDGDSTTGQCTGDWNDYINNFKTLKKYNFSDLVTEYKELTFP